MSQEPIYLTWLNAKGGFQYFFFTARNSYQVDVEDSGVTRNNLLPNWPRSYGTTANTINRQAYRVTRNVINLFTQHLTRNQLDALSYIKSSALVQIMYSRNDCRTVIVDPNSFRKYDENSKEQFTLQFTLSYTDEIPAQRI